MSDEAKNSNCQKTHKKTLRIFPYGFNLKIAPKSPQANRRVLRENIGGKVYTTQPPHESGFFMPAFPTSDSTSLSEGNGIKQRSHVNTFDASYVASKNLR